MTSQFLITFHTSEERKGIFDGNDRRKGQTITASPRKGLGRQDSGTFGADSFAGSHAVGRSQLSEGAIYCRIVNSSTPWLCQARNRQPLSRPSIQKQQRCRAVPNKILYSARSNYSLESGAERDGVRLPEPQCGRSNWKIQAGPSASGLVAPTPELVMPNSRDPNPSQVPAPATQQAPGEPTKKSPLCRQSLGKSRALPARTQRAEPLPAALVAPSKPAPGAVMLQSLSGSVQDPSLSQCPPPSFSNCTTSPAYRFVPSYRQVRDRM
ncbi:hypothetical protein B0J18DRAFT_51462 [Chaetomium sp. MPI-SDFR-AT-0129]|nr:hypothetical protein B0J18DRAFT_51462 [Chaetomium sp. MPI-SDFR-AT-0129]